MRQYPMGVLEKSMQAVAKKNRNKILQKSVKIMEGEQIRLMTNYSSESATLKQILQPHWKILTLDTTLKGLVGEGPRINILKKYKHQR